MIGEKVKRFEAEFSLGSAMGAAPSIAAPTQQKPSCDQRRCLPAGKAPSSAGQSAKSIANPCYEGDRLPPNASAPGVSPRNPNLAKPRPLCVYVQRRHRLWMTRTRSGLALVAVSSHVLSHPGRPVRVRRPPPQVESPVEFAARPKNSEVLYRELVWGRPRHPHTGTSTLLCHDVR